MADFEKTIEHSVSAFYAGGPGEPYYQPVMECSCGYLTGRKENWEYAGSYMDEHLTKIEGGSQTVMTTEEDQLALYAGFACKVYQLNDWVERGTMTAEQAMDRIGVLVGELKAGGYTRAGDVE